MNVNFFFVFHPRRVANHACDGRIQGLTGDETMKLVTVAEMRAIEAEADSSGLSVDKMVENAGRALAGEIRTLPSGEDEQRQALGLVGSGNNGADTLVALAHLAADG